MEDLDAAIGLGREGLELYPLGNPQRPVSLSLSRHSVQLTRGSGEARRSHCRRPRSTGSLRIG